MQKEKTSKSRKINIDLVIRGHGPGVYFKLASYRLIVENFVGRSNKHSGIIILLLIIIINRLV